MDRQDIDRRDCKPGNYNLISPSLNSHRVFSGREELLLSLERLLLKMLLIPSPDEIPESMESVRTFEGKRNLVTTFWFSELKKYRQLALQLMRAYKVKYN